MGRKRTLFVTHLYAPAVGGAERLFRRLAEGLAARGHAVSVLTSDALSTEQFFTSADNGLPGRETIRGVRVYREPVRAPVYTALKLFDKAAKRLGRPGVIGRPLVFGPHYSFPTFRHLLRVGFDAVVAGPVPTTAVFYGLLFRRLARVSAQGRPDHLHRPRLVFVPCMHTKDKLHASPLNRWALRLGDAVVALSGDEGDYLAGRGVRPCRISRLAAAVDDSMLEKPPSPPGKRGPADYVLYLGQEGEHKRIPLLLKAMAGLWAKGFTHPLVIAGARTQYSTTVDRVIAAMPSPWRGRIVRIGDFPESRKAALLDGCRLLVNPSSLESFGIVFLEAWARRKPVVGARIRAVRELIREGESGLLFEDKDAAALEAKIAALLEDPAAAARMGETGYRDVLARYRWPAVVSDFDRII
ncbi:MAG: glycosyltransferase family 4 protein, partial [Candidatus Aminicenantes bacterium]|nr:glycosyltransferase family 4 protein [Candidatus Aminicenantes bacterium]